MSSEKKIEERNRTFITNPETGKPEIILPRFKSSMFDLLNTAVRGPILMFVPFIITINDGIQRTIRYNRDFLSAEQEYYIDRVKTDEEFLRLTQSKDVYEKAFRDAFFEYRSGIYKQINASVQFADINKARNIARLKMIFYDINSVDTFAMKLPVFQKQTNFLNKRNYNDSETFINNEGVLHIVEKSKPIIKDKKVFVVGNAKTQELREVVIGSFFNRGNKLYEVQKGGILQYSRDVQEYQQEYAELYIVVPDGLFEVRTMDVYNPITMKYDKGIVTGGIKPLINTIRFLKQEKQIEPAVSIQQVSASGDASSWVAHKNGTYELAKEQQSKGVVYAIATLTRALEGWQSTPCRHCSPVTLNEVGNYDLNTNSKKPLVAGECILCKAQIAAEVGRQQVKYVPRFTGRKATINSRGEKKYIDIPGATTDKPGVYTYDICTGCGNQIEKPREQYQFLDELKDEEITDRKPVCSRCMATKDKEEGHHEWGAKNTQKIYEDRTNSGYEWRIFEYGPLGPIEKVPNAKYYRVKQDAEVSVERQIDAQGQISNEEGLVIRRNRIFTTPKPKLNSLGFSTENIAKQKLWLLNNITEIIKYMGELGIPIPKRTPLEEAYEIYIESTKPVSCKILSTEDSRELITKEIEESMQPERYISIDKINRYMSPDPPQPIYSSMKLYYDENGYEYFLTYEPIRRVVVLPNGDTKILYENLGLRYKYTGHRVAYKEFIGNLTLEGEMTSFAPLPSPARAHATNQSRLNRAAAKTGAPILREEIANRAELEADRQKVLYSHVEDVYANAERQIVSVEITDLSLKYKKYYCGECCEDILPDELTVENIHGVLFHERCNPKLARNVEEDTEELEEEVAIQVIPTIEEPPLKGEVKEEVKKKVREAPRKVLVLATRIVNNIEICCFKQTYTIGDDSSTDTQVWAYYAMKNMLCEEGNIIRIEADNIVSLWSVVIAEENYGNRETDGFAFCLEKGQLHLSFLKLL